MFTHHSSVRFICGTQNIHKELEKKIAKFHGKEDTILYPRLSIPIQVFIFAVASMPMAVSLRHCFRPRTQSSVTSSTMPQLSVIFVWITSNLQRWNASVQGPEVQIQAFGFG
jgi:hypothetical protein